MSKWVTAVVLGALAVSACVLKSNTSTPFGSSSSSNGAGPGTSGDGDSSGGNAQYLSGDDACSAADRPKNADGVKLALDCDHGFPVGAPLRGEGVAKDGTRTESGSISTWNCPGGNCKFYCKGGSCEAACEGGNCQLTCLDSALCRFNCIGGNCKTNCISSYKPDIADARQCNIDCPGGKCDLKCDPSSTACHDTCTGGDCKTAQK